MPVDFKKEDEVKEFIQNLGTEYRFGCFSEKKPDVCHLLGDYLEAIKKDYVKAGKIYKSTCDDYKFGLSCTKIGSYMLGGKGGFEKSADEGLKYFKKGCEYGDKEACYRSGILSILNSKSKKPTATFEEGVRYLRDSCGQEHSLACHHMSSLYMDGEEAGGIEKDMKKAFEFAEKACNLGCVYACVNVSIMYKKGDGVERNEAQSNKYRDLVLEMKRDVQFGKTLNFQEGLNPT